MSNILVTGGSGFIGSHLVKRLKKEHMVTIVDTRSGSSILGDIDHLFADVDTVFHLAALTRPQESIDNPVMFNLVNVEGTLRVLQHCKNNGVRRLIFVSTTGLYGEQKVLPTPEKATPNPMSPYALQKLIGEHYCQLFAKMYGMEINHIRPFNVYGVGQDPKGGYAAAVPKFIDTLRNSGTPFITGDGEQARDFIYVEDLVDLMILAATSDVYGEVFNAGSGISTSINDIYKIISRIMLKDIKPDYVEAVYEPKRTQGDIRKAKKLLGWVPKTSLEDGLKKTVEGTLNAKR